MTLTPATVIAGESVKATGAVPPKLARPVRLERKSGDTWTVVTRSKSVKGAFSFTFAAPATTTKYRVHAPRTTVNGRVLADVVTPVKTLTVAAQSATLTMPASAVTGSQVAATATFSPVRAARPVTIERRDGTTWTAVATGVQDATGKLTANVPVGATAGTKVFRARTEAANGAAATTSATRSVVVSAPPDTTPPGAVRSVSVTFTTRTSIDLSWIDPTDTDLDGVMVRRIQGTTPPTLTSGVLVADVPAFTEFVVDDGLVAGTTYSYALFAHDEVPNYAAAATVQGTTEDPPDTTPPGLVTGVTTSDLAHDHVTLSWTNPGDADFEGVMVRRAAGTTPPTKGGGVLVGTSVGAETSMEDYGLAPSKTYTYALFTMDEVPNYSAGVATTVTTPRDDTEPPGPVTDLRSTSATATGISLAWTNPTDTDFAGIEVRRLKGAVAPIDRTEGTLVTTTGPSATTFSDSGLASASTYSYAFFPFDDLGNYAFYPDMVSAVTDSAGASTTADWVQPRFGPEHRSWSAQETTIRPSTIASLQQEWSTTDGAGLPAIAGTTLYVSAYTSRGSELAAYDIRDSSKLWSVPTPDCGVAPMVTATLVILVCGSVKAYARGGSHQLVWDTGVAEANQFFQSGLVAGETVVVWTADRVAAFRLSDGEQLWQQLLPSGTTSITDVAVSGTRVVVGYDTRLRALSSTTGAQLWTQPGSAYSLAIADGWIYVNNDGSLRRFALDTGAPGWTVTPELGIRSVQAVDANTVYVWSAEFTELGLEQSYLRAMRTTDGGEKWSVGVPARVGGVAVTGALVWVKSTRTFADGRATDLIALNRNDGGQMRSIHFDANMSLVADDIAFGAGKVVAVHGSSPENPDTARMRVYGLQGSIPEIATRVLPLGRAGTPYSASLAVTADTTDPVTWSVVGGALPAGMSLAPDGTLSGTPSSAVRAEVTIRATSSNGRTRQRTYPLHVVPATSAHDWTTGGSAEARNPFVPGTGALDITLSPGFSSRWSTAAVGDGSAAYQTNVVVKGTRFYTVAGSGVMRAYDITGTTANRAPLWSTAAPGIDDLPDPNNYFKGSIAMGTTAIVGVDQFGRLHAVRISDGLLLWSSPPSDPAYTTPFVTGGTVVVRDQSDGRLHAFAVADGAPRWVGTGTDLTGWNELSAAGGRIYGIADCVVYALSPSTGAVLWDTEMLTSAADCANFPSTAPIVDGGRIYASEGGSKLIADAATGAAQVRFRSSDFGGMAGVVVGGLWIYGDFDGKIVAVDAVSGAVVWRRDIPSEFSSGISFAATGDLLIASNSTTLLGIDRLTGETVWAGGTVSSGIGDITRETLAIGGNRILVPTTTGVRAYGPL